MAIGQSYSGLGFHKAALEQLSLASEEAFAAHARPHIDRATALYWLAREQMVLDMFKQAESNYRRAIEEYHQLAELPAANLKDPILASFLLSLLYEDEGRLPAAEALDRRAISEMRAKVGELDPNYPPMLSVLADLRVERGDLREAEQLYRLALARYAAAGVSAAASPEPGSTLAGLCIVARLQGRFTEAEALCEQARMSFQRTLGVHHQRYFRLQEEIGALAHQEGQDQRAEALLREALDVKRKTFPPDSLELARTSTTLGETLTARGKQQEAEALLRAALALRRARCPVGDWRIGETASALGDLLREEGRTSRWGFACRCTTSKGAACPKSSCRQQDPTAGTQALLGSDVDLVVSKGPAQPPLVGPPPYTGQQFDPNLGFYYLRARYYDAQAGRFVTTDPAAGDIYDPVSLHRYLYANGNPVDNWDPTGRAEWSLLNISFTNTMYTALAVGIATFGISMKQTAGDWATSLGYAALNATAVVVVICAFVPATALAVTEVGLSLLGGATWVRFLVLMHVVQGLTLAESGGPTSSPTGTISLAESALGTAAIRIANMVSKIKNRTARCLALKALQFQATMFFEIAIRAGRLILPSTRDSYGTETNPLRVVEGAGHVERTRGAISGGFTINILKDCGQ